MSWETVAQIALLMGWLWTLIAFTIQMFKDTPAKSSKATTYSAPTPPPPPKKDR